MQPMNTPAKSLRSPTTILPAAAAPLRKASAGDYKRLMGKGPRMKLSNSGVAIVAST